MNSDARQALLHRSRCWIAENYEAGQSEPIAWENAVRAVFGLPCEDDDVEVSIRDFAPEQYTLAHRIFGDIVRTAGLLDQEKLDVVTEDAQICLGAWLAVKDAANQGDLSVKQRKQATLTAMLDGLQFYVTYITGGLFDATRDINLMASADFASLLEGGT